MLQHPDNVARRTITEELAVSFFVIRNVIFLDKCYEIGRCTAGENRLAEMRIGREKIFGLAMQIGEIAAASAGDKDLLGDAVSTLKNGDAPAAFASFDGAQEAGGTGAENDDIKVVGHEIAKG